MPKKTNTKPAAKKTKAPKTVTPEVTESAEAPAAKPAKSCTCRLPGCM